MDSKASLSCCASILMLAFAFVPRAHADVLVVDQGGGGDFTDFWVALVAAAPGDTVLVKSGAFGNITGFYSYYIDKDLVVTADLGATVVVDADLDGGVSSDRFGVRALPPGSTVVFRGITFRNFDIAVRDCLGDVRFEECTFEGKKGYQAPITIPIDGTPGVSVEDSASVAFHGCTLEGGRGRDSTGLFGEVTSYGGPGLRASASNVVVTDCILTGGRAGDDYYFFPPASLRGGHGAEIEDSFVLISGSDVTGGLQNYWYLSCVVGPGDGLVVTDTSSRVRVVASSFAGGTSGNPSCVGLDIVAPVGTVQAPPTSARGLSIDSPVRENATMTLTATGVPGDGIFAFTSLTAGYLDVWPARGVFLLGAPLSGPIPLGTLGAGPLVLSMAVPSLPVGIEAATFHVQAFHLNGGELLLGPTTIPTILDDSF